jgi:hypothetical protein
VNQPTVIMTRNVVSKIRGLRIDEQWLTFGALGVLILDDESNEPLACWTLAMRTYVCMRQTRDSWISGIV